MTAYYLDSSVALRILLHDSPAAAAWFDQMNEAPEHLGVSSRLLRTEVTRVLRRVRQPPALRDEVLDYLALLPLDHAVLLEAEAIVPHIKTLDAIHLGSALRSGIEDLVMVTHDHNMATVARELGFRVEDPVTDDPGT
nr:type II toxin-antitoxin system VapC family toxin [Flexivirga caeni]